jgi:hypothetical protein
VLALRPILFTSEESRAHRKVPILRSFGTQVRDDIA